MFWCFFYGYNSNDSHDTYVPKCFIQNTKHFVTLCLLWLLLEWVGDKPVCDNHRCSKLYIQHRSKGIFTFLCSFVALEFCTNEISRLMSWSRLLCSCVWIILSENKKHFMFLVCFILILWKIFVNLSQNWWLFKYPSVAGVSCPRYSVCKLYFPPNRQNEEARMTRAAGAAHQRRQYLSTHWSQLILSENVPDG